MGKTSALDQFRKRVLQHSLFPPCELGEALKRFGFLQADPIRCPARAQDLILRHRVKNYRAGDLEHRYPELELEECFLYAYGFGGKELWQLIHPKTDKPLTRAEQQVLELVDRYGPMHPKQLASHMGNTRSRNAWGGVSRTVKMTLDALHSRGALRVSHREKGVRLYASSAPMQQTLTPEERFQKITLAALDSIGPTTRKFLLAEIAHYHFLMPQASARRQSLQKMLHSGQIRAEAIHSVEYIYLNDTTCQHRIPDRVRLLAPFDPLVRDRTRFEHLWEWSYRFEAYTPATKRKMGYYAMPVLWQQQVIGWANANVASDRLRVHFEYVNKRPRDPKYRKAAKQEVAALARFLKLGECTWQASI
ncbi:MAG: crosslink repair DNA glycosylase YcaQ family protein [Verrucomicrobiota bacterium]